MEIPAISESCIYCKHEQEEPFKFCPKCGKRNFEAVKAEKKHHKVYILNMRYLAVYALFSIVLLLLAMFTEDTLESFIIWTLCFAGIDLVFALLQPTVWNFLKLSNVKILPALSITGICIVTGIIVSYTIDYLNPILFEETLEYMPLFYQLDNSLLYSIVLVGIFPAFFEELAFRGFVFNNLKIIGGVKSAIWGSSFLFALVHLSILSLIWILPFGLLLAFYRQKYTTIVYGIIGHFTHNTTTVLIEYYGLL